MKQIETKKRNYASPQKLQTSIEHYTNQKKMNNKPTPPRTAIDRAYKAFTNQPLISPPKAHPLSNNPYKLLADVEEETPNHIQPQDYLHGISGNSHGISGTSLETEQETDEDGSSVTSNPLSNLPLSRKAQLTLRKIRSIRKVLTDNSLRAEIEAVLGTDNIVPSLNDGSATDGLENPLRNELISETNQEGLQETAMQIDEERVQDQNSSSTNEKTKPSSTPNSSTHAPQETQSLLEANQDIPPKGQTIPTVKNVSFAASVSNSNNPINLRTGILHGQNQAIPQNPYLNKSNSMDQGTSSTRPAQLPFLKTDKAIILKKNTTRLHIHRYTLRFETIAEKNAEEGQQLVKDTLQRFLGIALQVDPKTIIPPYLELDRNDKAVLL